MKKLLISAAVVALAAIVADGRTLTVKSVQTVDIPQTMVVGEAVISADGSYVVMNDLRTNSLAGLSLASGRTETIAPKGSMLDLKMTPDGSKVVYRQRTVDGNKRTQVTLHSTDVATKQTRQLCQPTRHFSGFALAADGVVSTLIAENDVTPVKRSKSLNGTDAKSKAPVVGIHRGDLVVTDGNGSRVLNPQGKGSYLWPSISPDGKKIVYYKSQEGCFVCNLDGSGVIALGYIHAPKWFDNNTVIGMEDYDNGSYVTSSCVVASDLNGKTQKLTDDSFVAMYPSGSSQSGRIVFSDNNGKLYLMTVE